MTGHIIITRECLIVKWASQLLQRIYFACLDPFYKSLVKYRGEASELGYQTNSSFSRSDTPGVSVRFVLPQFVHAYFA
jgi:hypothetical protein